MYLLPPVAGGKPLLDVIHHCDALTLLRALPDACVDCFVTSPPYNLRDNAANWTSSKASAWARMDLRHGYSDWNDDMPYEEYVAWQRRCLAEMVRVVSPTGAIFYNHKWRVLDKQLRDNSDIVAGFPVRQIIIWDRGSGHNSNPAFFTPQFEVIYVIAKPGFKVRNGWQSYGDVWRITPEHGNPHPAPFPIDIPTRCILATDPEIVSDPFCGSGTTALAAAREGRHYICADISRGYVVDARARLALPYTLPMFA